MKRVVITGSTRGIGFGLARELATRGCRVAVSGRSAQSVDRALDGLSADGLGALVTGWPCDVTKDEELQALWDHAFASAGGVDVWVNNAGEATETSLFWDHAPQRVERVVRTNLLGTMLGSRVAMLGMLAQGHGHIWNVEGFGSRGRVRRGMSLYATTKSACHYFNRCLILEARDTPVRVGTLSPGMVLTDMVSGHVEDGLEDPAEFRRVFNAIGDRVEDVVPFLADAILGREDHGADVRWLTRRRMMGRVLLAKVRRRDLFAGTDKRDQ